MSKIYFVQHQAHGVAFEFPFGAPPSSEQIAAVNRYCFQHHGFGHAKTPDQPYWTRVIDVDVLGPNQVPEVAERALGPAGKPGHGVASPTQFGVSGVGHVTEGKK